MNSVRANLCFIPTNLKKNLLKDSYYFSVDITGPWIAHISNVNICGAHVGWWSRAVKRWARYWWGIQTNIHQKRRKDWRKEKEMEYCIKRDHMPFLLISLWTVRVLFFCTFNGMDGGLIRSLPSQVTKQVIWLGQKVCPDRHIILPNKSNDCGHVAHPYKSKLYQLNIINVRSLGFGS